MNTVYLILYIVAAVLLLIATIAPVSSSSAATVSPIARVRLLPLGLFFAVLVPLIRTIDVMNH